MVVGIDFGSTTIKIVLMDGEIPVEKYRLAKDEDYLSVIKKMDLSKITKIVTVGVGASFIEDNILGIQTEKVEEFQAAALGGCFLSGCQRCMVVSLGTGTSFIFVNKEECVHTGGTGMGGALLQSLARNCMGIDDVNDLLKLAEDGAIERADLQIRDISMCDIPHLYGDTTVANMAKIDKNTKKEDYALGICNMVFQNIGVMSVMADRPYATKTIVIMGSVGQSKVAKMCFDSVSKLFGYEFLVPDEALYGVAIGAVLYSDENFKNRFT